MHKVLIGWLCSGWFRGDIYFSTCAVEPYKRDVCSSDKVYISEVPHTLLSLVPLVMFA